MKRCQNESALQISVAQFLDVALPDEVRAFHVPNGGRRDARTGARLKREGVKAGVPDFMIVARGSVCGFIELKTEKGRLSEAQREWRDWCWDNHVLYAACRSLPEVADVLRRWGVELKIKGMA